MALFASASLVLSRPQDRRIQTRGFTDDLTFNLGASPNGFTIPSPSEFLPSSPDGGSSSSIGFPNLGFNVPEAPTTLPQALAISDSFGSTELPTDYTNTLNLPGDGASDVAIIVQPVQPPPENPVNLQTKAVKQTIDSVSNGQLTYAILEATPDLKAVTATYMSNEDDWNAFAEKVRTVKPSYVLRSVPDGILFIFTFQRDLGFQYQDTQFLYDNSGKFQGIVHGRSGKRVYGYQVHDDGSLRDAIDSHSKAPPIVLSAPQLRVPGW